MSGHIPEKKLGADIARVLVVVAVFAVIAVILERPYVRRELFDLDRIRSRVQSLGWAGTLVFIIGGGVVTGIGVPRLWISAAAGTLFGAILGTVAGHAASMIGATLNFYIARLLLRGPISRRMPARLRIWYDRFGQNGFRWLLYMRLFPLSNATVTNVVGGVSQMRYRDFFLATFVGY